LSSGSMKSRTGSSWYKSEIKEGIHMIVGVKTPFADKLRFSHSSSAQNTGKRILVVYLHGSLNRVFNFFIIFLVYSDIAAARNSDVTANASESMVSSTVNVRLHLSILLGCLLNEPSLNRSPDTRLSSRVSCMVFTTTGHCRKRTTWTRNIMLRAIGSH
jgi:hypothetical protein